MVVLGFSDGDNILLLDKDGRLMATLKPHIALRGGHRAPRIGFDVPGDVSVVSTQALDRIRAKMKKDEIDKEAAEYGLPPVTWRKSNVA